MPNGDVKVSFYYDASATLEVVHVYRNADGTTAEVFLDETVSGNTEVDALVQTAKIDKDGYAFARQIEYEVEAEDVLNVFEDQEALTFRMPAAEVKVSYYYDVDANGDNIPDKYQETIVFAAVNGTFDENGSTQLEKVITFTENGEATGKWDVNGKYTLTESDVPAATAAAGYTQESQQWDDPQPLNYTMFRNSENEEGTQRTFTVRFTGAAEQTYIVQYIDEDTNEGLLPQTVKSAPFGSYIDGENEKVDIPGYVYTRATDLVVTEHNEINYVFVYYTKDVKGPDGPDGKPDKYQIVFTYVSADDSTGTVTGVNREVYTFQDANKNYVEPYPISPNALRDHEAFMNQLEVTPAADYAFHYWTVEGGTEEDHTRSMTFLGQDTYMTDTTFVAHFAEDTIGEGENPDNPDGVPDMYQITFTYQTEDAARGTVTGTVTEVRTFPRDGETGEYDTTAAISPNVNVTINTIGSYRFDNWTNGAGTVYDTNDLLKAASFTDDQTFTAHFYRVSSGGNGSGGSSGGSGGSPYTPSTGGPGVTITDPEVPLAPLPDGGNTTIIDDSVPLAPLPKTGQQTLKAPITMLLTGIFLAFASLTKRKEEN